VIKKPRERGGHSPHRAADSEKIKINKYFFTKGIINLIRKIKFQKPRRKVLSLENNIKIVAEGNTWWCGVD
jgi:hypothetical protein